MEAHGMPAPETATLDDGVRRLFSLMLPGLDVRRDWRVVHDRLLDDFGAIEDVLATTLPATLLIVYVGPAQVDRWLDSIEEAIAARRRRRDAALRPQAHA